MVIKSQITQIHTVPKYLIIYYFYKINLINLEIFKDSTFFFEGCYYEKYTKNKSPLVYRKDNL